MLNLTATTIENSRQVGADFVMDSELIRKLCLQVVYPYALRRVGKVEDAEDITSDVFLAAVRSHSRLKTSDDLKFWLLAIARRRVADVHRRRRIDPPSPPPPPLFECAYNIQVLELIRKALYSLPEPQREALMLTVVEGMSASEVGMVMRKSVSAVNSLIHRARTEIKRQAMVAGIEEAGGIG